MLTVQLHIIFVHVYATWRFPHWRQSPNSSLLDHPRKHFRIVLPGIGSLPIRQIGTQRDTRKHSDSWWFEVYLPLWKIWVSWDHEIPNWMKNKTYSKPPTRINCCKFELNQCLKRPLKTCYSLSIPSMVRESGSTMYHHVVNQYLATTFQQSHSGDSHEL